MSDWAVSFAEVWGKENIEKRAGQAFNSIRNRQYSNALGLDCLLVYDIETKIGLQTHIFNVGARVNSDNITVLDA